MGSPNEIRENAKRELGEWFAGYVKKSIADSYRFFRSEGIEAVIAIALARAVVQHEVDGFIRSNFHSHIPGSV